MGEQLPVQRKGMTPVLRMAVLSGVKASVQLHLRLGGVVDAIDDKGRTPLILAASRGHAEICRLLLDAGADLAHVDMEGNDALSAATAKGHHVVAELIRAAVASPAETAPPLPQVVEVESPGATGTGMAEDDGSACLATSEDVPEDAAIGSVVGEPASLETEFVAEAVVLLPEVPVEIADGTASEVAYGSTLSLPWHDAEKLDLSEWVEETDSPPPPADPACAGRADELQRRLSLHIPVDMDEGWDDVDIDLPDIMVSLHRRAKLDSDEEAALGELVLTAIANCRVRGEFLGLVAPRDQNDLDMPDPDYVANLRVMLGDMGVIVDDDPAAPDRPSDSDDEDDRVREEAAEGMAFLRILNSNRADPLTHYIGSLPRDRLTRDEEASLAMEIERGTKAALAAVAMSPAAVSELLAAVDAVIGGETPPEDVLESDDEDREDDDAGFDEDGGPGADGDDMLTEPPLPPELLFRLEAIRDLCRRISQGQDGGFTQRLGDLLAALGLSHAFISCLRRAVETDPSGGEARRLMEAGLESTRRARERFALTNLKLVVWGAKKFGGLTWPDRIQEGNLGLLKAVERFDHRRGVKFSTYATWWIKQAVTRAVADKDRTIRIPVHAQEAMRKLRRAQNQVFALTGRDALPEEIADLTEIPLARVRRFLAVSEEPASLDVEEVGLHAAEMASPEPDPEERLAVAEIKTMVRGQLEFLPPREATVIRLRFGIGCEREYTLEEVGQQFGVTRERIRQIEAKAIRKLSHPGRIKALQGCR
jgi:RNA polymerase primary sigma factor